LLTECKTKIQHYKILVSGIQHKKQNVYDNNDISHRQLFETPLKQEKKRKKKEERKTERKKIICVTFMDTTHCCPVQPIYPTIHALPS
jgi:hypothetical protein